MSDTRSVNQDEITQYLFDLLESELNVNNLRDKWKEYMQESDGHGKHVAIYKDLQAQLPATPAIELVYKNADNTQISIGSQHTVHNYELLITVGNNHPTESKRFCNIIAGTVADILNSYDNRAFLVPSKSFKCYDSYAEQLEVGFRRGQGLITIRIPWWAKLFRPDRH